MKIKTSWLNSGKTVKIPLCPPSFFPGETLNLTVNWGDGSGNETITSFDSSDQVTDGAGTVVANLLSHQYTGTSGHKTITITGGYGNKIAFMQTVKQDSNGDTQDTTSSGTRWLFKKIFECNTGTQFYVHGQGDFRGFGRLQTLGSNIESLTSANPETAIALSSASTATMLMDKTFFNCPKLQYFGEFSPTNATSLQYTLSKCVKLNKCQAINDWDMEKVTIATGACKDSAISVGLWKWFMESESKDYAIEDMSGMFEGADFNKGINGWDLSTVKDTSNMFKDSNFNKPIWKWFKEDNVLENMDGMFQNNEDFDKGIQGWDLADDISQTDAFDGAPQVGEAQVPSVITVPELPVLDDSGDYRFYYQAIPPSGEIGTFNSYDNVYTYGYQYQNSGYYLRLERENAGTDNEYITIHLKDRDDNQIKVYDNGSDNGFDVLINYPSAAIDGGFYHMVPSIDVTLDTISEWPSS